jgi:3-dehydroquinate dehydratase-1
LLFVKRGRAESTIGSVLRHFAGANCSRREIPRAETGGQEEVVRLYASVCESRCVDLVDFEMSNPVDHVRHVRDVSRKCEIQMVMSYHNFRDTPALDTLVERFAQAQELGADVAKVAVMPNDVEDVLRLLSATLQSSRRLKIPLISMTMDRWGTLTRLVGCVFGSAVTFAVGERSSAPGQVPIEDLEKALSIMRKVMGPSSGWAQARAL